MKQYIQHTNRITSILVNAILCTEESAAIGETNSKIKKQQTKGQIEAIIVQTMEKIISIGTAALAIRDYSTVFVVTRALCSSSVGRLKHIFKVCRHVYA